MILLKYKLYIINQLFSSSLYIALKQCNIMHCVINLILISIRLVDTRRYILRGLPKNTMIFLPSQWKWQMKRLPTQCLILLGTCGTVAHVALVAHVAHSLRKYFISNRWDINHIYFSFKYVNFSLYNF